MDESNNKQEVLDLISLYLDGSADRIEQQQLADWLESDPEAREIFRRSMQMELTLLENFEFPIPVPARTVSSRRPVRRLRRFGWPMALAACLVMALTVGTFYWMESKRPVIAKLTSMEEAVWADGQAWVEGDAFKHPQPLRLVSGKAEVTFAGGSVVSFEGPADLEILEANRGRLNRGRLLAEVPERARGFEIESTHLLARDLGTTFGMEVAEDGRTEVHVLQGVVDAFVHGFDSPEQNASPLKKRLKTEQAVRLEVDSNRLQSIGVRAQAFAALRVRDVPGVITAEGDIELVRHYPKSLVHKAYASSRHIRLLMERDRVVLPEKVRTLRMPKGPVHLSFDQRGSMSHGRTLRAGRVVRVYLFHFDPKGQDRIYRSCRVTFAHPIAGVMVGGRFLAQTHATLGRQGVKYGSNPEDGLEDSQSERMRISADRRTLELYLMAGKRMDQVRVLVSNP